MKSFIALVFILTSAQQALAGFPCCILRNGEWVSVCKDVECPKGRVTPEREEEVSPPATSEAYVKEAAKIGANLLRR